MQRLFSVLRIISRFNHNYRPAIAEKVAYPTNFLSDLIDKANIRSNTDWKTIREEALTGLGPRSQINVKNIDALTLGVCTSLKKYDLAFSYLNFLKSEKINLNLAIYGKIFKLLYVKNENKTISQEDEKQILDLYEKVRSEYPVLDSSTCDNTILALSLTKKWEVCKDLLNEIKISTVPNTSSYSALVAACFSNNDNETAWKLLDEMLLNGRHPLGNVFKAYLQPGNKYKTKNERVVHVEKMFEWLHSRNYAINNESAAHFLKDSSIESAEVNRRGICLNCKTRLKKFDLSDAEFSEIKRKMFENVIIGKDIFNKSTPEELQKFKAFIDLKEQYDVVVDGLNVAYTSGTKNPKIHSLRVASVVTYFANQNRNVLVLGRSHMKQWPNWNRVTKNASVFLTQDLSQDDPFLLYCALNSGKDTIIVTKDLMRGHKFLLKDFSLKILFDRWLMQRQYQVVRIKDNDEPIFKIPLPYSNIAQKHNSTWHVPYVKTKSDFAPILWLCAKL